MLRVGQKLKEARIKKKLTFEEISKATKIRVSFLSAIEEGAYHKLPEKTYVQGFVGNYAEYLGLPKKEILPLFRREFDENAVFKVLPEGLTSSSDFFLPRVRLGKSIILIGLLFVALITYLLFQYRFTIFNPSLEITSPKENATVSLLNILVSGKTDPSNTLYVNDHSIPVDNKGLFSKQIDVFSGKTTITIKAVSRFGKQTIIERHIDVKP